MPPLCESFSCNFATQDISDLKSHSFCSQHFRYTENFLCCCCLSVWWVKFLISDIITLKIWDCSRYSDNSNGVFHLHDVTSELTCLVRGHVSRRVSMPGLLGPHPSVAQSPAPAPGQPLHWFLEFLNFGINVRRMHLLQTTGCTGDLDVSRHLAVPALPIEPPNQTCMRIWRNYSQ